MKSRWIGWGLAAAVMLPNAAWSDEKAELKSQIDELRQAISQHQQEMLRRQAEDAQRQQQLIERVQALQAKLEQGSGSAVSQPAAASLAKESADRPSFLDRLLHGAGVTIPSHEPMRASERDRWRRQTPSGHYADPTSFFLLHAYTTVTYADFQRGLGSEPGANEQILVAGTSSRSGKHESGFRNDSCLFIGSEVSESLEGILEIHNVGNALNPVVTESKIVWSPIRGESGPSMRFVGGRYWWPFGIHSGEWFSALNAFSLLSPVAEEVVPAHWNALGVMAEGEWPVTERMGFNYLFSVDNGVTSFELADNVGMARTNQFDQDANRTFTTRLGVFPGIENLSLGASLSTGVMRHGLDTSYAVTDARRYEADLLAYGFDGTYRIGDLGVRGYWYVSQERLTNAPLKRLDRDGGTLDVLYTVFKQAPVLREITLKGRVSTAKDVTLTDGSFRRSQYGLGINARPQEHFLLKTEYFIQDERGIDEVKDNGFALSGTVEF